MARLVPVPANPDLPNSTADRAQRPANCNFIRLLANSPVATEAYLAAESALARGLLSAAQRELLAVAVAEINGAHYCLAAHSAKARRAGVGEAEVRAARQATAAEPRTQALLRFVQAVVLQRGDLSDADFQALRRAGFTDGLVAEIVAGIGLNLFTNYFNTVARTDAERP